MQGYNVARNNLTTKLATPSEKPKAIILDIDETVLDNSPYQAYNALNNRSYPHGWDQWVKAAKAKAVPGAKDFLNYANEQGVQIYYVSDREQSQLKATIKNLTAEVAQKADVIMLFGDNLSDFNDPAENTVAKRTNDVMQNATQFGDKYIILPNPMYGNWEAALYNNNYQQSDSKKSKLRKSHLTYFDPKTNMVKQTTVTTK